MNKLLALDQASHTTGYTIFHDQKAIKISHFTARGSDLGARLVDIRKQVLKLIEEHDINEVVFEDIQLQQNVQTFKMLAEVYGVIQETLEEINMPYTIVTPNVWKATFGIAGYGRGKEKNKSINYVLDRYGIECTDDEADSCLIGTHVLIQRNKEFDWS